MNYCAKCDCWTRLSLAQHEEWECELLYRIMRTVALAKTQKIAIGMISRMPNRLDLRWTSILPEDSRC
jgi:hypothetical protein